MEEEVFSWTSADQVKALTTKKRGRPLLVGEKLDKEIQSYLKTRNFREH